MSKIHNFVKALSLLVSLVFAATTYGKAVVSDEYKAVIDTAHSYFNGAAQGDQTLLTKAFDTDFGHIKMITKDKETGKQTIRSVPLGEFAKVFKKATKDTWEAKILSVDIVEDTMAIVKLDFDTPKTHYIDYLVMYKRNGQWKIINKTFYSEAK